ncbi:hypothetical protein E6H26_02455 [Candidatus Bathyarchaeota archaeon]|nr:MAG: hypothetical protein E6H26_02455 [Candidatus Bathyarchaeota archaeon]
MRRAKESAMARRFWKRRTILFGAVVVALSIGVVFTSVPFLPNTPPPHSSITTMRSYDIRGGNQSRPGYDTLTVSGISSSQAFWVGVTVMNGPASFCVLSSLSYQDWVSAYNQPGSALDRLTGCILGPTQQVYQNTLKFQVPYSGTWVIMALNSNPQGITVDFGPA